MIWIRQSAGGKKKLARLRGEAKREVEGEEQEDDQACYPEANVRKEKTGSPHTTYLGYVKNPPETKQGKRRSASPGPETGSTKKEKSTHARLVCGLCY